MSNLRKKLMQSEKIMEILKLAVTFWECANMKKNWSSSDMKSMVFGFEKMVFLIIFCLYFAYIDSFKTEIENSNTGT